MSGSDPGEMASESSKAVVFPKFDMHIYAFELTSSELGKAVGEYSIPLDLHPRLPPPGMTMNKLSSRYIGLYIEQLEQGVIDMDTFLKLPTWTGTVVSSGDPILEDQPWRGLTPKSLLLETRRNSRALLRQKPNVLVLEVLRVQRRNERGVVDLSGNTRVPTLSAAANQPLPHIEHHDIHDNKSFDAHSSQSSHQGNEDELVDHRYVPNWGLCDDVYVCTFCACRELISHLATLAEDEFSGNLSNVENHNDAYSVELEHLREGVVGYGEDLERERDAWRETASDEVEKIWSLEKDLEPRTQQLMVAEEKIGVLERDKLAHWAEVAQAEADLKKLVREFIHAVVKRSHTNVEYRKSLAFPVSLCFATVWLEGLSLGKTDDQIAQFLSKAKDLDIDGSKS
uniref:Uncharacterized protein n=1 Tax=Tanacetum cinerariifolium TaxID=118510 RepID=A0A699I2I1_TANCI|nr:hypothetical protein [Tanacetum cinerariifolium]